MNNNKVSTIVDCAAYIGVDISVVRKFASPVGGRDGNCPEANHLLSAEMILLPQQKRNGSINTNDDVSVSPHIDPTKCVVQ